MPLTHTPTHSSYPQGRVFCTLSPAEVDTHFLNISHAQHILPHAWHTPLEITLPLQTSVHSETSIVFWWITEGAPGLCASPNFFCTAHTAHRQGLPYSLVELHAQPAVGWPL